MIDVRFLRVGDGGSAHGSYEKKMKRQNQSKMINVGISFAAEVPIKSIAEALIGQETEHLQEAISPGHHFKTEHGRETFRGH